MKTDVLIVGAGPTGLMLANQLGRRGIRVMLIDRHNGPAQQTRAMGVQARTLEIYAKLGIAQQAIDQGARTMGANIWAEAKHKARVPVHDIGKGLSPFPFVLMLGQDDNERILGETLRNWNISVQWNTELTALTQHHDHVTASLRQSDGSQLEVSAAWVAGCDGSHSSVRNLCGIEFPGAPYEHVFFVADTVAAGDMVQDELNVYLWKKGFHLFFPMRDRNHWRVIGILPSHLRDRDVVTFEDVIPHISQEAGTKLSFDACNWFSTYRIQHRCASLFRASRCFLLGDAAHIHSPMGAQGMNTGLQDAYNLGWKLAMVVRGEAGAELLDTYETERRRVAQALLRGTDRAFSLVVSDTPLAAFFRTKIMGNIAAIAMRRKRVQSLFFRLISQIGIRYRHSPLSRNLGDLPDAAPRAGDRFPWLRVRLEGSDRSEDLYQKLDDLRFSLIVVGQPAPLHSFPRTVDVLVIPTDTVNRDAIASAMIPATSFYLLRPDGHIAMAGLRLDTAAITRYLADEHLFVTDTTEQEM